jgi:hypothetical protein
MTEPATADPVYGLCMKGWIHTIEIYTTCVSSSCPIGGVSGYENKNWDYIFNADNINERNDFDNLVQSFIYKTNTADKSFRIGTATTALSTPDYPLYMATTLTTHFRKEKTIIFEWDSSIQNGIIIAGVVELNPYIIDSSSKISCPAAWATTTSNVNDPYYQPKIGRITTNTTKYLKCDISA